MRSTILVEVNRPRATDLEVITMHTRLRAIRRSRRMNQHAAAALLGCDQTTVSLWELGKVRPQPRFITRLELAFGEHIDALLAPETTNGAAAPAKASSAAMNRPAPVKEVEADA